MLKTVIPSEACQFFLALRSCEALARAVEESLFSVRSVLNPSFFSFNFQLSTVNFLFGTNLSLLSSLSGLPLATTGCAQQRTHSQGNPHPPHRERPRRQSLFRAYLHYPPKPSWRWRPLPPQALSRTGARPPLAGAQQGNRNSRRRPGRFPRRAPHLRRRLLRPRSKFLGNRLSAGQRRAKGAGPSLAHLQPLQDSRKGGRLRPRGRRLRHQRKRPPLLQTLRLQHSLEARLRSYTHHCCRNAATRRPLQSAVGALLRL